MSRKKIEKATSVCFTYRIYPFRAVEFSCSCIRDLCVTSRKLRLIALSSLSPPLLILSRFPRRCLGRPALVRQNGSRSEEISPLLMALIAAVRIMNVWPRLPPGALSADDRRRPVNRSLNMFRDRNMCRCNGLVPREPELGGQRAVMAADLQKMAAPAERFMRS